MTFISIFRLVIFSLSLLLSLAILGLTAHLLNISTEQVHFVVFPDFEAVSVVATSLSIISLALFVTVGAIRRGAFFNMIVVEFTTIVVLWVLWIVVAARTADWWVALGCNAPDDELSSLGVTFCHETVAIEGLSFLIWIILLIFLLTLIVYIIIGKSRGNTVWTVSVAEATFFSRPGRPLTTGDIGQPQELQFPVQTLGNIEKFQQFQLSVQPHTISMHVQHQRYECPPPSAGLQAMNYPVHSDHHNLQMMPQV